MKVLDETGSTNDHAKSLVMSGAEEGLVVVARCQRCGRGRYGRSWCSPPGGLYVTFVIRPRLSVEMAPLLGLLVGCAVVAAVERTTGINIRLKWPNDLQVRGRKVGGILSELVVNEGRSPLVLVGLGLNVNTPVGDLPPEIQSLATTLLQESGMTTDLDRLLAAICEDIDLRLSQVDSEKSYRMIIDEWKRVSDTLGRTVRVKLPEGDLVGMAVDIIADGSLVLQVSAGERVTIRYGEVTQLRDMSDCR